MSVTMFTISIRMVVIVTLLALTGPVLAKITKATDDDIWQLIKTGNYDAVERKFDAVYDKYKKDLKYEDDLFSIYEFTDGLTLSDKASLLKWVSSNKDSFNANLVLGLYYRSMGWQARGTKYISKTPEENRMSMREFYDQAEVSLKKAISINKSHPVPYHELMVLHYGLGQREIAYKYLMQGLRFYEGSYELRSSFIHYVQPKWGGSTTEFEDFIKDTKPFYDRYAKLKKLEPLYYRKVADFYDNNREFDDAIKYYKKSLEYGNDCHTNNDLGWLYQRIDQHDNAIKYTDATITGCPDEADVMVEALRIRARAKYDLGDKQEAFDNFSQALKIEPENPITLGSRGGIYYRDKQYENALKDLNRAIAKGDPKLWMLTTRAKTYKKLKLLNEAIQDYTDAIKINSENANYYERRGRLLIELELYNAAKKDVNAVLKLKPDNKWALHYKSWAQQPL